MAPELCVLQGECKNMAQDPESSVFKTALNFTTYNSAMVFNTAWSNILEIHFTA